MVVRFEKPFSVLAVGTLEMFAGTGGRSRGYGASRLGLFGGGGGIS